jgi:hypothetical protein
MTKRIIAAILITLGLTAAGTAVAASGTAAHAAAGTGAPQTYFRG